MSTLKCIDCVIFSVKMSALMLLTLKENLECPICMDTFIVPKLLPCGHTFCANCIDQHIHDSVDSHSFNCPICQSVHKANISLTNNWILVDTLDKINEVQSTLNMYSCSSCLSESAYLCENCCELLCMACHIRHTEREDFLSHQIVILSMDEEEKYQQINEMEYSLCQRHNGVFKKNYCTVCNIVVCTKCVMSLHHVGHKEDVVSLCHLKDELVKKCADNLHHHRTKFQDMLEVLEQKSQDMQRKKDCLMVQWQENMQTIKKEIQEYTQEKKNMVCPAIDLVQTQVLKNDRLRIELESLNKGPIKYNIKCLQELDAKIVALESEEMDTDVIRIAEASKIDKEFVGGYLSHGKCEHGTSTEGDRDCQEESIKVVNDVCGIVRKKVVAVFVVHVLCLIYVFGIATEKPSVLTYLLILLCLLTCQTILSMASLHILRALQHIYWMLEYRALLCSGLCLMALGCLNIIVGIGYFWKCCHMGE